MQKLDQKFVAFSKNLATKILLLTLIAMLLFFFFLQNFITLASLLKMNISNLSTGFSLGLFKKEAKYLLHSAASWFI